MATRNTWQLWSGFWTTSLGTLAGRVLGLVRDIATASLLGLGEGGVMDAFVLAFRGPNLLRRIFGEGALAVSFLPAFSTEFEQEPRRGWQLLSVLLALLAATLAAFVLIGEVICAGLLATSELSEANRRLIGLLATMLPYLILICLAAQTAAALQALLHFRLPALSSTILNLCWLAATWGVAPYFADDKLAQAYVIAGGVLISGMVQLALQLRALRRLGFHFDFNWSASRESAIGVARAMLPITLGLAVTQLNTLMDSALAWCLSSPDGSSQTIAWLGHRVAYPMQTGAAAAIYYGERFYQLPVGLLGAAVATVMYPLLARHVARGNRDQVGADLTLGLRLICFLALPAAVGMMLTSGSITRVLFERGEFTAEDSQRAATMIACYASGVWAYCSIPVIVRSYYAMGDRLAPARLGVVAVGVNLALNLALIWPLGERALAISTATAAGVQVVLLASTFSHTASRLDWSDLCSTIVKSALACLVMALTVVSIERMFDPPQEQTRTMQAVELALVIAGGAVAYVAIARILGMHELTMLLRRPKDDAPTG